MLVTLGRSEIAPAMADAPLFLAKDGSTGAFEIAMLAGLIDRRNLFWRNGRWQATYVPEIILSAPFRLAADSPTGLVIDRENARLGRLGDPLFTEAGEASPTLEAERRRLQALLADVEDGRRTAAALVAHGVMRAVSIAMATRSGARHVIEGLYSLNRDAMAALPDDAVVTIFRSGDLAAAVMMAASDCQLERLRQLHNMDASDPIADIAVEPA